LFVFNGLNRFSYLAPFLISPRKAKPSGATRSTALRHFMGEDEVGAPWRGKAPTELSTLSEKQYNGPDEPARNCRFSSANVPSPGAVAAPREALSAIIHLNPDHPA
jgi:hypothetical protein